MTINDYFNNPINEDYFSISPEWDTSIHGGWEEDYFSNKGNTLDGICASNSKSLNI